ncbi:transposase [Actinacidiphila glaucinigra]|uniref:transposase n=1 Tax=Actinacidiphila glaucinigra TaxID=235986 RepID=UPI003F4BE1F6
MTCSPHWHSAAVGLIRFDGHLRSGASASEGRCLSWRAWGKKKPRPRRSFTPEFKAEIVELCRRGDRSVGQVAKDFDLTETAVRDWVKQAEVDAGERDGLTSDEREELARLRRENRRLREDVEVLKRATAFFATETR